MLSNKYRRRRHDRKSPMSIRSLCFSLVCAAVSAGAAAGPALTITTEYSPPTSMLDHGTVTGSATDRVRTMLDRIGVVHTISMYPWKRAYSAALSYPNTCVYSTTRTPEREPLFKWVGPTAEGDWVLIGLANHDYKVHTLDDARKLRIGTYFGDARDDYLRRQGFQTDPAHNDVINPQKLLMGRIDLWAASMQRGSSVLKKMGLADKLAPVLVFKRIKVYLACNRSVPDALIHKMNAELAAMAKDGTLKKIEERYDNWESADGNQ